MNLILNARFVGFLILVIVCGAVWSAASYFITYDGPAHQSGTEYRPDPPEDIPSMDPELTPPTNADRRRPAFQNSSISIFNNSNKTVRLAYTYVPQQDGKERSVYAHRERSELSPGQTIEDHEGAFGGPYHISVFANLLVGAEVRLDVRRIFP